MNMPDKDVDVEEMKMGKMAYYVHEKLSMSSTKQIETSQKLCAHAR